MEKNYGNQSLAPSNIFARPRLSDNGDIPRNAGSSIRSYEDHESECIPESSDNSQSTTKSREHASETAQSSQDDSFASASQSFSRWQNLSTASQVQFRRRVRNGIEKNNQFRQWADKRGLSSEDKWGVIYDYIAARTPTHPMLDESRAHPFDGPNSQAGVCNSSAPCKPQLATAGNVPITKTSEIMEDPNLASVRATSAFNHRYQNRFEDSTPQTPAYSDSIAQGQGCKTKSKDLKPAPNIFSNVPGKRPADRQLQSRIPLKRVRIGEENAPKIMRMPVSPSTSHLARPAQTPLQQGSAKQQAQTTPRAQSQTATIPSFVTTDTSSASSSATPSADPVQDQHENATDTPIKAEEEAVTAVPPTFGFARTEPADRIVEMKEMVVRLSVQIHSHEEELKRMKKSKKQLCAALEELQGEQDGADGG